MKYLAAGGTPFVRNTIFERFLVTGGAGFIGSHVSEELLNNGNYVVCVDNFDDYYNPKIKKRNIKNLEGYFRFSSYNVDIRDCSSMDKIFSENKIDKIIHLAAKVGVRASLENPKLYYDVNVNGTKILLDLASRHNIKDFIFASSSSVYGENKKIPFCEVDEINKQISPYAKTKKDAEILCEKANSKDNMNLSCLRFFTVYGPRGRPDMAPFKFVDLISNDKEIDIYVSEEEFENGKMARDFTYIDDIVNGILFSAEKNKGFNIFNLGRREPVKLNEFISVIEKTLDKKARKNFIGRQKGDVLETYANISKAENLLDYNPRISIEEGIKKFVDWYKEINQNS